MNGNWVDEWRGMPDFFVPTRDTEFRNKIDISDTEEIARRDTSKLPKYPIYIVSKGRSDAQKTAISLNGMGIPHKVVVEPDEYENYASVIGPERVLKLPFGNLGQGSTPARNWILEHSISQGHKRHWILDDNIGGFGYQKGGRRINTRTNGDMFRECEDFVDRYNNIKLAGMRYRFHHNYVKSPYYLNTRVYSCILVDNSIEHRWRGKFNEDTDLSLRVLKDGDCTMLFIWCYCNKAASMSMKGGNTESLYKKTNNRLEFAESLREQHPDVVAIVKRYGRWHHKVNYKPFRKNILTRDHDIIDYKKAYLPPRTLFPQPTE